VPLLSLSLAAVAVQFTYTILAMQAVRLIGAGAAVPFPLTIFVIGALLVWFASVAHRRGWIAGGSTTP
jgi:hypothetical protein